MNDPIHQLARHLVQAEKRAVEYEQRLFDIESSRKQRLVISLKRFLRRPLSRDTLRAISMALNRQEPKKARARHPLSVEAVIDSIGSRVLPHLGQNSPDLRYPALKCAVIGDESYFAGICHTFNVESGPWEYLLDKGMEILLINPSSTYNKSLANDVVSKFSEQKVPIVFFVHSRADLSNAHFISHSTHIIYDDIGLRSEIDKTSIPSLYIPLSADITLYNPINWQREPSREEFAVSSVKQLLQHQNDIKTSKVVTINHDKLDDHEVAQIYINLVAMGCLVSSKLPASLDSVLAGYETSLTNEAASDTAKREKYSIYWRRHVISNHSRLQRFNSILEFIGYTIPPDYKVSIILSTSRPTYLPHALENIKRQGYKNKELVLILHGEKFKKDRVKMLLQGVDIPVKVLYRPTESLFGDNLNLAVEEASGELIAKMDDDDWYGPHHIDDLVAAWRYSRADIVGKWANIVYVSSVDKTVDFALKREEQYGKHLPGGTILTTREFISKVRFGSVKRGIDSELYRRIEMRGSVMYSTHRYNFIRVRHNDHTYAVDDSNWIDNVDTEPRPGLNVEDSFV